MARMSNQDQNSIGASSFVLEDGRRLSYKEAGFQKGKPVLYFHGCPGSCLEVNFLHLSGLANQLRIIGIDRPGIGGSSVQNKRTLDHWCSDINELLCELEIKEFSIIGFSAGATYSLRCLSVFNSQVNKVALVSPFLALTNANSLNNDSWRCKVNFHVFVIRQLNALFYIPLWLLRQRLFSLKGGLREYLHERLPDIDKPVFKDSDRSGLFSENLKWAFIQSARSVARDLAISATPLKKSELHLASLSSRLRVWSGGADENISPKTRKAIMALAEAGQLEVKPLAGHCLVPDHANEICNYLASS